MLRVEGIADLENSYTTHALLPFYAHLMQYKLGREMALTVPPGWSFPVPALPTKRGEQQ